MSASTSPTTAMLTEPRPQRILAETCVFNFQLLTRNHLQLPQAPTPPTLKVPCLNLKRRSGRGVWRRKEGKRLMNNPFDTVLQAKEEKID